jgi:hypothetical protein
LKVGFICSNFALVANLEIGSDVDTKISFGISCRQMNRHVGVVIIHCINMLVVVLAEMHHFAFINVEFHEPFVRPANN